MVKANKIQDELNELIAFVESYNLEMKARLINSLNDEFDFNEKTNFSLYLLGSLSRNEASYYFDNDSYIIFEEGIGTAKKNQIVSKIIQAFTRLNIADCEGEMSFDNPLWQGTLGEWIEKTMRWSKSKRVRDWDRLRALSSDDFLFGNERLRFDISNSEESFKRSMFTLMVYDIFSCHLTTSILKKGVLLKVLSWNSGLYNHDYKSRGFRQFLNDASKQGIVSGGVCVRLLLKFYTNILMRFPANESMVITAKYNLIKYQKNGRNSFVDYIYMLKLFVSICIKLLKDNTNEGR